MRLMRLMRLMRPGEAGKAGEARNHLLLNGIVIESQGLGTDQNNSDNNNNNMKNDKQREVISTQMMSLEHTHKKRSLNHLQ